jgi:hypothetical protein
MTTTVIKSTRDRCSLAFSDPKGDYFKVEISGGPFPAIKRIRGHTNTTLLVDLFESIASPGMPSSSGMSSSLCNP